ncbi:MAG: spore germination protein [Clostridia bacterium]|nr:spore germination protein [Clostridia bacterium]
MKLEFSLKQNLNAIKEKLTSTDIVFLELKRGINSCLIFVRDLVDKEMLGELVLRPLEHAKKDISANQLNDLFLSPEKKEIYSVSDVIEEVLLGNAVLICNNMNFGFSFGLIKFEKRAITEPPTSAVIKGPREGFVESLPVNISMMRRRIKSSQLQIENFTVGKYSKTTLAVCYVKGIADNNLVKKVKKKINEIDIDAVLDSSYISKFIGEHKTSIYKQVGNTEKPDILTAKIMEGRVAIFVDGSPIALTVPYLLIEDFQSPSDYYNSSYSSTLARAIRLISVFISILLPAFFVTAELFHLQLIPLSFLLTIVNSIKGIPLSPSFEMFFTLLIFEILNEASVRMPKYVGMVVSIVGGLVLGETAVTAGIISAPTLMIVALSGICLYTVPELEQTFSLIRFIFLIIGGSIGGYGLIIALVGMLIYTVSFESFCTPIFAPFSPLITKDLKDGLYKGFLIEQTNRPYSIKTKNRVRLNIKKRKEK